MKIIYNNLIPFKGFVAINLFGILFARNEYRNRISNRTINHESIHTAQIKEMGYIFFYIQYIAEWLVRLFINSNAYRNISFEREAYSNDNNPDYLKTRKRFSWLKYIKQK